MTRLAHPGPWLVPACLMVICLVAYEPGRFENTSGDNVSSRYWPVAILKYRTLTLNPFREELRGVRDAAIFRPDGNWLPRTNWGMMPLLLPVYLAADAYHIFGDEWTSDRISRVARLAGIVWSTLAVIGLYQLLLRFVSPAVAFVAALLFAVGTWNWSVGAQGPSMQTGAVLLHVVNLHLLWRFCTAGESPARTTAFLLGAVHAWLWTVRPQDIYLVAPVGLLVLARRHTLISYLAPFGAGVAAVTAIYISVYGTWVGYYGALVSLSDVPGDRLFRANALSGALGLLFSPNRGAIVFFPLLLVVPYVWYRLMPPAPLVPEIRSAITGIASESSPLARFSLILALGSGLYFVSLSLVTFWHGSWGYGARYLYDLQPYVWVPVALALADVGRLVTNRRAHLHPVLLTAVVVFGLQGVLIHGLGHRNYDLYIWNVRHNPVTDRATWDTRDWIIADAWNAGPNRNRWPTAANRLRRYGY